MLNMQNQNLIRIIRFLVELIFFLRFYTAIKRVKNDFRIQETQENTRPEDLLAAVNAYLQLQV